MIATNILEKFISDKKKCKHERMDYDHEHKAVFCAKCSKVMKRLNPSKLGIHIGDMLSSPSGRLVTVLRFTKTPYGIEYGVVSEGGFNVELPLTYLKTWKNTNTIQCS